jgi:hypothetical protein
MTTASPDPLQAAKGAGGIQPPQTAKEVNSKRQGRRKAATVSWYGSLLIVATLLVAAGWETFRWILAIITLDRAPHASVAAKCGGLTRINSGPREIPKIAADSLTRSLACKRAT